MWLIWYFLLVVSSSRTTVPDEAFRFPKPWKLSLTILNRVGNTVFNAPFSILLTMDNDLITFPIVTSPFLVLDYCRPFLPIMRSWSSSGFRQFRTFSMCGLFYHCFRYSIRFFKHFPSSLRTLYRPAFISVVYMALKSFVRCNHIPHNNARTDTIARLYGPFSLIFLKSCRRFY